jgi:hypothetical protein
LVVVGAAAVEDERAVSERMSRRLNADTMAESRARRREARRRDCMSDGGVLGFWIFVRGSRAR